MALATRIHAEAATSEVRASDLAIPRHGNQLAPGAASFVLQGESDRRAKNVLAASDRAGYRADRAACAGG
jgi:hypothetical protein